MALNTGVPQTLRGWPSQPPPTSPHLGSAGAARLARSTVAQDFLAALAILDDLGAVTIIAVFYTDQLAPMWLAGAVGIPALLIAVNLLGVMRLPVYLA
jgi:NhaA family Na+:H+ antiporter